MRIALDYDGTFTADKQLWRTFVTVALALGHEVTFVTYRMEPGKNVYHDNLDILADSEELGIPIVFTNHRQKSHVFKADIWIDDMPQFVASYDKLCAMKDSCEANRDMESDV